ncbi:MAG: APC family permease [Promethearchaeota archaeon]
MAEEEFPKLFVRRATGLRRELGSLFALSYPLNLVIGPWIFLIIPAILAENTGADLILALAMGAIPAAIFMLNGLFLSVAMPRSGGDYTWVSRCVNPAVGYVFNGFGSLSISLILLGSLAVFIPIVLGYCLLIIGVSLIPSLIEPALVLMSYPEINIFQLIVAVVFVLLFVTINALGPRPMKWVNYGFFAITMIFSILLFAVLGLTHPDSVPSLWDSVWGSGAYQEIVDTATAAGWMPTSFSFDATLDAMRSSYFLYLGGTALSFFGSEIKVPKKSFSVGFVGGIGIITAIYIGFAALLLSRYGEFVSMYSYVMFGEIPTVTNPSVYPVATIFALSLTANPVLQFILALGPAIWTLAFFPAMLPGMTRLLFSMSFDRFLPERLTKISERTHSPYVASIVIGVSAIGTIFLYAYAGLIATALETIALSGMAHFLQGLTSLVLPFSKPAVWRSGFSHTVKGFPVMSILGVLTICLPGFFMTFFTMLTANVLSIAIGGGLIGMAMLVFSMYAWKNQKEGMSVSKLYGEVPPI